MTQFWLFRWFEALLQLFFPRLCLACREKVLEEQTPYLCLHCQATLPETKHYLRPYDNELLAKLKERSDIQSAVALFIFQKGNRVQSLIHAIKYESQPEAATMLGEMLGTNLQKYQPKPSFDALIPVPLHAKKEHHRGYNQSQKIAEGMSEVLGIEVNKHLLKKVKNTASQARKNRLDRLKDMEKEIFLMKKEEKWAKKHFLLIDDVVTTGATLQACCDAIKETYPDCQISVATLAFAK